MYVQFAPPKILIELRQGHTEQLPWKEHEVRKENEGKKKKERKSKNIINI